EWGALTPRTDWLAEMCKKSGCYCILSWAGYLALAVGSFVAGIKHPGSRFRPDSGPWSVAGWMFNVTFWVVWGAVQCLALLILIDSCLKQYKRSRPTDGLARLSQRRK